jgi:hypothetical protein
VVYTSGIVVRLTGQETRVDTTDSSGNYSFSGLYDGGYFVGFTLPPGYTNTTSLSNGVTYP